MRHYNQGEWEQYVRGELPEQLREELEEHLYTCDQCLEVYISCVEGLPALPDVADPAKFHSSVMAAILAQTPQEQPHKPFYLRTFFHYGVAAAVTLLLTTAGVFDMTVHQLSEVASQREEQGMLSQRWLEQRDSLWDVWQHFREGGREGE